MEKAKFEPFREQKSEEIQEIISHPPHWLVRCGNGLLLNIVLLLCIGTWWIRYPDVIHSRFLLTSRDAPRTVVTRSEGKLLHLAVKDGQYVSQGQTLAYLESTADPVEIVRLSQSLNGLYENVLKKDWQAIARFQSSPFSKLGEIQTNYQLFDQQLNDLKSFLPGGFYTKKMQLFAQDSRDLRALKQNMQEQLSLQKNDLLLAQEEFSMHDKLFKDKVISTLDFKREKGKLLSRQMPVKNLEAGIIQNSTNQVAKQKEILELYNLANERKNAFLQSLNSLQVAIAAWKQKYLLSASVGGRLSFSAPWQAQQHLTLGQELIVIEPDSTSYQGIVKFSQINLGKIQAGQIVFIKLDGFPYREYGVLEGRLEKVSLTPGRDSLYWGYVTLPSKLRTRFGRTLPYRNGLKGQAEIVTTNKRLANRLVDIFKNGTAETIFNK